MVFLTMQKINLTLITIDLLELIKQEKNLSNDLKFLCFTIDCCI